MAASAVRTRSGGRTRAAQRVNDEVAEPRHRAWDDIHDRLPDRWRVGPTSFAPGRSVGWSVAARSPKYAGRLRPPAVVTGVGEDELGALTDLALKLRELANVERRIAMEERARAAYLHGAEMHSRATLSRPLTPGELERVLERYRD
jgi:hypothetical protein